MGIAASKATAAASRRGLSLNSFLVVGGPGLAMVRGVDYGK